MYERRYGKKYDALGGKWVSAADIAKLMRADIKELIGKGELPGSPKNYSVKIENYSGGRSIRIKAIDLDGMWEDCDADWCRDMWCKSGGEMKDSEHARVHEVLSPEGMRVKDLLKEVWEAYNHDGSDAMVDYFDRNYYGGADIEDARQRRFRLSEKKRLADRKAARAAKAAV